MSDATARKPDDLISWPRFLRGLLAISWRLPAILATRHKLSRIPEENRESWGSMLEENAARFPRNIAVKSAEATLTYAEYNAEVNRVAHALLSLGVKKGDVAAVLLENRPELLIIYSALAKIGAINSMINTNLRRASLTHCLTSNSPCLFVVGEETISAFEEVRGDLELTDGHRLLFVPDSGGREAPADSLDLEELVVGFPTSNPPTTSLVTPEDPVAYIFTSGTTGGLPKAAVIPHGRTVKSMYFNGRAVLNVKPHDTIYVPLPFFHTNAVSLSWPAVFAGGAALAIRRKFSASGFWDDVRRWDVTIWCYVGELCRYLVNQPPRPDDRSNPLRKVIGNGLRPEIWRVFKERFDIPYVYEIYGAAESNLYFVNLLNLDRTVGLCIMPYAIVAYDVDSEQPVRGPDGWMRRVAAGETGLVLGEITEENPFAGYTSTEATESKILRDVFTRGDAWFNTGDLLRSIGFGHAQFMDRTGDTFRWKGENVSTTEVEQMVNTFPGVSMCTAYGVSMPGGDGRAGMVAVIPEEPVRELDLPGLAAHLRRTLPSYAVPKFLRMRSDFEYTPTHKIKKVQIREEGFDPARVTDPLYVLLPDEDSYRPLTPELYRRIVEGAYRF